MTAARERLLEPFLAKSVRPVCPLLALAEPVQETPVSSPLSLAQLVSPQDARVSFVQRYTIYRRFSLRCVTARVSPVEGICEQETNEQVLVVNKHSRRYLHSVQCRIVDAPCSAPSRYQRGDNGTIDSRGARKEHAVPAGSVATREGDPGDRQEACQHRRCTTDYWSVLHSGSGYRETAVVEWRYLRDCRRGSPRVEVLEWEHRNSLDLLSGQWVCGVVVERS
jgi:hypothetical protein